MAIEIDGGSYSLHYTSLGQLVQGRSTTTEDEPRVLFLRIPSISPPLRPEDFGAAPCMAPDKILDEDERPKYGEQCFSFPPSAEPFAVLDFVWGPGSGPTILRAAGGGCRGFPQFCSSQRMQLSAMRPLRIS